MGSFFNDFEIGYEATAAMGFKSPYLIETINTSLQLIYKN